MARRRRRKKPNGGEAIAAIIVIGMVYIMLGDNLASNPVAAAVLQGMKIPFFILIGFVLILGFFLFLESETIKLIRPQHLDQKALKSVSKTVSAKPLSQPKHTEWSIALIEQIEWRVFENLCTRLREEKGFSAKETNVGADGGVDFYLYAKSTKQKIGAVQCKSWSKKQIGVNVLRELQGVVASEQLKLGLLMYSGELSKAANEFLALSSVSIKAQGGEAILAGIEKLDYSRQQALLSEVTSGDYMTPSCPNCDVKLVERTAQKTGDTFMGCVNFPQCRYTTTSR